MADVIHFKTRAIEQAPKEPDYIRSVDEDGAEWFLYQCAFDTKEANGKEAQAVFEMWAQDDEQLERFVRDIKTHTVYFCKTEQENA